jgi:hypothetical protein
MAATEKPRYLAAAAAGVTTTEDQKWNRQLKKLIVFRKKNGYCLVPEADPSDKSLANWVRNQRVHQIHKNILRPDRKERLEQLDFFLMESRSHRGGCRPLVYHF